MSDLKSNKVVSKRILFLTIEKMKKGKDIILNSILFFSVSVICKTAFADTMPWESPGQKIEDSLTGTTAHIAIVIAIAVTGIGFAIGEHGSLLRRGMAILLGASIAVGAASLAATMGWA